MNQKAECEKLQAQTHSCIHSCIIAHTVYTDAVKDADKSHRGTSLHTHLHFAVLKQTALGTVNERVSGVG